MTAVSCTKEVRKPPVLHCRSTLTNQHSFTTGHRKYSQSYVGLFSRQSSLLVSLASISPDLTPQEEIDHIVGLRTYRAAENGHANIIELLADKFKASIFERTKDGSTLMHIASLNGHADCAMMLFKKGVYLHMPNKDGARSIHTAARYGHVGIINTLLQKGEKVDVTTNVSFTSELCRDNLWAPPFPE
ncbi:unnamed protein product [Acanthoscelides obtectus]|uniref:Uncharacterized protein n=1 Tax=Acanthoscelides obtectus TaxID=200917 RepID=A0A9P0LDU6_ACAOB|nr:unnamed protein product [Acanthoscelides obtectus]CAK1624861.1 Ankyrin repeat, PH and SEC7 domain containing protein secG [Acanthoscelides obtectus]